MAEGQYSFSIGLDDKQLKLDVAQAKRVFDDLVKAAHDAGAKIDGSLKNPFDNLTLPANLAQKTAAATQSFNGLNMATQQIVRELPAATMGINTFFLAVSNNLPVFADQVKQLQEDGESIGDIFKQVGESLFSWQSALILGVTALTMYGKEIGNWIAGLFKGKVAVNAAKEAQEELNKAISEGGLGIQDEIRAYERLRREWTALNGSLKEQEQFINDNKDAFNNLGVAVDNVRDAENLFIGNTEDFLEAMRLRAEATAAEKIAVEQYEKAMIAEMELSRMSETKRVSTPIEYWYMGYVTRWGTYDVRNEEYFDKKKEAEDARELADAYYDVADAKQKAASDILKGAGIKGARNERDEVDLSFLDSTEKDIFGNTDRDMARATEQLREELSKRNKAWEDYIIAYGTFQERLLGTTRKYERLIAEAETEGERMALEAERDAILAEYEVQASEWAQELVSKTAEQLNTMIEELQAQVEAKQTAFDALDSSDSGDAKKYREEINRLNAQIKLLQQQLGKAKKDIGDDNWADATLVFQNISQAANDAAEGLAEFDEGAASILRTMGQLAGSAINLIGAIQAVTTASAAAAGTISAMEKASVILAVIGAAIQAVSTLISLFKGSDEVEQTMRQFKELNAELEHFRKLAQIDSVEGTIFGEDAFGNFSNNLRVMREALSELNATSKQLGRSVWSENFYLRNFISVGTLKDTLANIQVKTRDRSDFAEAFGATDEYSNLATLYPELFAGDVTLKGLQNLKNSDVWEKISQENRDLIDELIADWERYDEATKAVTDYLNDIFGELGQEINDAIVDAFANGTDAAVAFGDVAGKMLENLISQIGYTAYIAPILSKAMEDVANLNKNGDLSAEDYLNALMGIVGDTIKAAEDAVDGYNEFLERSDRMAEEQGISTFNGERTAAAKGIAQASQDSVDELNGRMTAIQSHTSMLVDGQKQLINDSAQALTYLAGIESNTAHLEQMRYDMGAMRRDISDIATRGIVTR